MGGIKKRKIIQISILAVGGVMSLLLLSFWLGLHKWLIVELLAHKILSLKQKRGITIAYKELDIQGISTLHLNGLTIQDTTGNTGSIQTLQAQVDLWKALRGKIQLKALTLQTLHFDWSLQADSLRKDSLQVQTAKFAKLKQRLGQIDALLDQMPAELSLQNAHFSLKTKKFTQSFEIKNLQWDTEKLDCTFLVDSVRFWLKGDRPDFAARKLNLECTASAAGIWQFPFLEKTIGLGVGGDKFRFRLHGLDNSEDEIKIKTEIEAQQFTCAHKLLAKEPVWTRNLKCTANFSVGKDFFEWDSSSTLVVNDLRWRTYAYVQFAEDTIVRCKLNTDTLPAQQFLDAIPKGMTRCFDGIKLSGKWAYHLNFAFHSAKPDSTLLDSKLVEQNVRLEQSGNVDLTKMNGTFKYHPYRSTREIIIDENSSHYTHLPNISPFLVQAVLTSEDPGFHYHRGILSEAFCGAIIENIRRGRFRRGGSTISMQLVKNIYLSHEKTVARKLEELLLVWLIESKRLVPKEKMLEVYFNIIEWGPNIYGITEAAQFYFNTTPAKLNISQSVYLSMIIPRPKTFRYCFKGQRLHPAMQGYYRLIGSKLLAKKAINEADYEQLKTEELILTGPARKNLTDATPNELIESNELESDNDAPPVVID